MVSLGIILLVCGIICAIACYLFTIPIGVKIGFGLFIFGIVLVLLGYLLPLLSGLGDGVDEPNKVGMSNSAVLT